jgi:hypothetical protein
MTIGYSSSQKTLKKLHKFYQNEERGVPHDDAELFDLAWDLAEWLEDSEYNFGRDGMIEFASELREAPTVVNIDTAVNWLHQTILDYGFCTDEERYEFLSCEGFCGDIVEFLLERNQ